MDEDRSFLIQEGRILYRLLLGRDPHLSILERYAAANLKMFGEDNFPRLREVFRRGGDVEALEFAWRLKDPTNPLTGKMHIMIYLAEARPENFSAFFNIRKRRLIPWLILSWQFLRSVYKGLKGWFLLKRWSLA